MKKILSILLALVMIFTMTTIAFAAGEDDSNEPDVSVSENEDDTTKGSGLEDIPLWQVKVGAKVGKVIVKIVIAFVKVGLALGIIDSDELIQKVKDMFGITDEDSSEPTTAAPTAEAPAVA